MHMPEMAMLLRFESHLNHDWIDPRRNIPSQASHPLDVSSTA
jgi:hypothetical protein